MDGRGGREASLDRQQVGRKIYLAQVAVERGGPPLDRTRVARRVTDDGLPLAKVQRPGVGMWYAALGSTTVAGGRASASHWAVSRMAAPSTQSLLYQPQEARVVSCDAAKTARLKPAPGGPRFCGSGGSGTPGSSRSSSACSRSKREKRKRTE